MSKGIAKGKIGLLIFTIRKRLDDHTTCETCEAGISCISVRICANPRLIMISLFSLRALREKINLQSSAAKKLRNPLFELSL